MCISLLYEFMKNLISITVYLLLLYAYCKRVLMHVYTYKSYVSHSALSLTQVLIRVGIEEDVRDLSHTAGPTN